MYLVLASELSCRIASPFVSQAYVTLKPFSGTTTIMSPSAGAAAIMFP
jgi:hypothetical protein